MQFFMVAKYKGSSVRKVITILKCLGWSCWISTNVSRSLEWSSTYVERCSEYTLVYGVHVPKCVEWSYNGCQLVFLDVPKLLGLPWMNFHVLKYVFGCRSWFSLEQNCWFIEDKLSSTALDFIRSEGIAERQHLIWGKASSLSMPRTYRGMKSVT